MSHISTTAVPFHSAEEAWFWHLRACEFVGKPRSMWPDDLRQTPRPCEPHEIFRAVCIAYKGHVLTERHMRALARSTCDGMPTGRSDIAYFEGAMAVLDTRLRAKGVIQ